MTPLAYLLMSAALQSIDPRLEEASSIAGAGTWPTLRRVTLPLVLPAGAAAALLLFIQTVESFEVPLLLGGRARIAVYTTEVYFNTSRMPTDWGLGEHLRDGAARAFNGITLRLFSPGAPRRALPNDHRQRLSPAPHRSRQMEILDLRRQPVFSFLDHRSAFLSDALRLAVTALPSSHRGSAAGADAWPTTPACSPTAVTR